MLTTPPIQEPEVMKLTVGHILAAMGFLVALTSSLVAYLWNLLTERVKVTEGRLNSGSSEFTAIKVKQERLEIGLMTFESNHETREKLSDHYRESTLKKVEDLTERVAVVEAKHESFHGSHREG